MRFYRGVIEDNNSPKKDGKVRVRIHGLHGGSKGSDAEFEATETASLPWAEVMGGTAFGLISGVGLSNVLRQGTWVWVVLDNDDPNKPIVIGTITGIVSETTAADGFADPSGVYPLTERVNYADPESSPVSRVGRSDLHPVADGGYPNTTVLETPGGHVVILTDTEIKVYHNSGSSVVINAGGSINVKSVADVTWDITGNLTIQTGGTHTIDSGGNYSVSAPRIDLN